MVFSVYYNVQKVLKRKKYKEEDLLVPVFPKIFDSNKYLKKTCIRIFNDIENSFYTYNDLLIALLYENIFGKFNLNDINEKQVKEIKSLFTLSQLKKDKKIIHSINKNTIFNTIEDYFKINSDNETYIYFLIKKKFISPIFWLKYEYLFDRIEQKFEESEEHYKFRKICKYIKSHY